MSVSEVAISAPSRLHFGLLSLGDGQRRQYGGLGAMVQQPGLRIVMRKADRLEAHGPLADRAVDFASRYFSAIGRTGEPPCRIEIHTAPPEHVGLGTGTQLGLAVGTGLSLLFEDSPRNAEEVARLLRRGLRSAIGTHGFCRGGLLLEHGKLPGEAISPLVARAVVPSDWRFMLLCPRAEQGLWGESELEAFSKLPPIPQQTTDRLTQLATEEILPAAAAADFDRFSAGLFRYGHEAGMCFATQQGGPFATPSLGKLVERIRGLGISGIGQSSWGPTIYALLQNSAACEKLRDQIHEAILMGEIDCTITPVANEGAKIDITR